jgi:hypothetical protein
MLSESPHGEHADISVMVMGDKKNFSTGMVEVSQIYFL